MPALTMQKRLSVVRHYFDGLSYEEIARKSGVAKGTVANVIGELKAGHFPQVRGLEDQLEALREVAVGLKRAHLSPAQSALGLVAFRGLESLGVEPSELEQAVALYRELAPDGMETQNFVRAALALKQLQDRTGRGPEELEVRATELEQQCNKMAPLAQEVTDLQQQRYSLVREIATLNSQREDVETQVEEHRQGLEWLQEGVGNAERLIEELGRRYLQREGESQDMESRLNEARRGLDEISRLGLPLAQLPELASHLTSAARHQGVEPEQFHQWFISCLQGASSLLGLETLIKARREQLEKEERALAAIKEEMDRCGAQVEVLKRQRAKEEAAHQQLRETWHGEILSIGDTLKDAANQEAAELKALGTSLREDLVRGRKECQEIALEMGRLEEAIDSHPMVRPLVSLLQGKDGLTPGDVRVAATALCLGLMGCLERDGQNWKAGSVSLRAKELLQALERWTP